MASDKGSIPPQQGALLAGRYKLVKLVGEGRTGRVFQAKDLNTQSRVAVKLLHPQLATVKDEVRRFTREFETLQRLDHPNVVHAYGFGEVTDGEWKGTRYLVMEFVEGKPLDEVLAAGPLEVDRAARIVYQVARALEAAHAHDIVHRDVEPSNVHLARSRGGEVVKVLDFGVARLAAVDEAITDVGVKLGTAEYMSPEYVEEGRLDTRSDLYALGVLSYAVLTGAPPFVGPALKVMQDHVGTSVPPMSSRVPGLPPWLEVLTMALLAKDPAARPADAAAVVAEIERNIGQLDAQVADERKARASLPPEPMAVNQASVGHRSDTLEPVYPDPKPAPPLSLLMALLLGGLAMLALALVIATTALVVAAM